MEADKSASTAAQPRKAEFRNLYATARKIHEHFAALYGQNPWDAAFELDFRIDGPDRSLFFKQVRPYCRRNQ